MQKTTLFAAFVLVAAVLLSGCTGQPNAPQTDNVSISNSSASNSSACQQNSVYFIHADWCPHCQKMKPWVLEFQSQGYKFVMVTSENLASYKDCLTGVAKMQYIPEFVCLSTSQSHIGEFDDENALKAFADTCGAGSQ